MEITTELIKDLRDATGISIMQCKKALEDAGGDIEKAKILLRKKGSEIADKKGDRNLGAGAVSSYIHNTGNVGSMVVLYCETDFVAKNEEFKSLAYDIAMQIAANDPLYVSSNDIDEATREKTKEVLSSEIKDKSEDMKAKIIEGKMTAYFAEKTLLDQPFIKNPDITIGQMIKDAIQKFGERIEVGKFTRFSTN